MNNGNVFSHRPLVVTGLIVVAIEVIAAFLGNGFIVTVNLLDWLKKKRLNPLDDILEVLAFSNAELSYIYGHYIFCFFAWPEFFQMGFVFPMIFALALWISLSSSWLIALLCLYFCFKIIHFKSSFLTKLKMSIDSAVVWLILISEVIAFSCSIPVIWSFLRSLPQNITAVQNANKTVAFKFDNEYVISALGISSSSSSLIIMVSLVYIIWSLCRHTYLMKKQICLEDDSMLKAHKSAAKSVLSLLLIYVLFCTSVILNTSAFSSNHYLMFYWWLTTWMLLSFPSALSVALIFRNSKLWLALQKTRSLIKGSIHKALTQG